MPFAVRMFDEILQKCCVRMFQTSQIQIKITMHQTVESELKKYTVIIMHQLYEQVSYNSEHF